jgi:stage V sporulation protein B
LLLQNVSSPLGGAQKAAWAVLISYLFSFTAAFVCFLVKGGSISSPKKQLKSLFNSSMPITSVRASNSLIASAVAVILPAMLLKTGFSESEALQQFGIITGMVIPILFIPATLIGSISLVLVPELSEDFYKHNQERLLKNIQRGIKFSFLTACIFLPFFYAFGEDIGKIAFSNVQAGVLIRKSCFILPAMCLAMISTSILNSMGFERKTFLFYLLGEAGMLVCIFFLPSVCGIFSYTLGMTASFFITGALNLFFIQKKFNIFKKEQGQVRDYSFSRALLLLFPLSFFGQFISSLCKKFAGGFLALVFAALILTIATLFVYLFFIFPCKKRRKKS